MDLPGSAWSFPWCGSRCLPARIVRENVKFSGQTVISPWLHQLVGLLVERFIE